MIWNLRFADLLEVLVFLDEVGARGEQVSGQEVRDEGTLLHQRVLRARLLLRVGGSLHRCTCTQ